MGSSWKYLDDHSRYDGIIEHQRPYGAEARAYQLVAFLEKAWQRYREKAKAARVLVLGLRKQFHGGVTGATIVASMLDLLIARARKYDLEWVEFSWILEVNDKAMSIIKTTPAEHVLRYRLYAPKLAANHGN